MYNVIVGTAGHIDHGKTALITALNGYDGDGMAEEKERGITIDLSFSNLKNSKINIAFIDVPGHEKLIKNMISGAFGFDYVLLVISASEGIMPQTKEHIDILNLLGIKNIIVAVSKSDLVDEKTLILRKEEIKSYLEAFNFTLIDIKAVSIYDEKSIALLKTRLFNLQRTEKQKEHFFRFYIDRVFSPKGIGTVVTGTVLGDEISVNDKVFISDIQKETRIKNIQIHNQNVLNATISNRVALNLHNINEKQLNRGFLISKKGMIRGFNAVDIYFECLENQKIYHNRKYSCFIGSRKIEVKVLLYDTLDNQTKGFANLKAYKKLYTLFGEKLILRDGDFTIAGAKILNPISDPMKKRQKKVLLRHLYDNNFKSAYKLLLEVHKKGLGIISSAQRFALSHKEALELSLTLDDVFVDEKALIIYPLSSQQLIKDFIQNIYKKNQYALLSIQTVLLRLKWASEGFIQLAFNLLVKEGVLIQKGALYQNKNVKEDFFIELERAVLERLKEEELTPTAPYNIYDLLDIDRKVGDQILKSLTAKKKVKRLQHNLFIHTTHLQKIVEGMREIIKNDGVITLQSFKNYFPLSRKYLIAYLEYLDQFDDIKKEDTKRFFRNL